MRIIKTTMLFVLVALLLQSCYKEDDITADLDQPHYVLPKSDHPLDIALNKFKAETKANVLYTYKPVDHTWNLTRKIDSDFVQQSDKDVVLESWNEIKAMWLNHYNEAFIKEYVPYKIFLSDTLKLNTTNGITMHNTLSAFNYIAFGNVNSDYALMDNDQKNVLKGQYHGEFFANYLYRYDRIMITESFFKESKEEFYDTNLKQLLTEQEKKDKVKPDPKEYGFWHQEDDGNNYTVMSPSKIDDVNQFVNMITSYTQEELDLLMVGYPKLETKYNIIIQDIKDNFNIDLQVIGNDK